MIQAEALFLDMINNPVRKIKARVELLNGSTLLNTFSYKDNLISFTIERVGAGKFFGFGVCQKLNVKLIDTERALDITTDNTLDVAFGVGSDYIYPFPQFHVTEVNRDEATNELSITAYDALNAAHSHFFNELDIIYPYTLKGVIRACGAVLGLPVNLEGITFDLEYPKGANFEGKETIRAVLDAAAEATQTIYYLNSNLELVFKRLGEDTVYEINKSRYFELDSRTNRRLTAIAHVTELGDNVTAALNESGSTHFIRENAFLELREDIAAVLDNALADVGGLTINQFSCSWRGNFLLEVGDKIALTTKDNATVYSYLLDDVIEYNGILQQNTQWSYEDNEGETDSNPTNLGDALKQTYARVDKANKTIDIVASETEQNKKNISKLFIDTEGINATVSQVEQTVTEGLAATNQELQEVSKQAALAMTAEDVTIAITNELANGVDKVTTSTGFTFDSEGLKVSKSSSDITTQITEDGMKVSRGSDVVLTANNEGVIAEDLHATTYLIIGKYSRFEDYTDKSGSARTGCFWIG